MVGFNLALTAAVLLALIFKYSRCLNKQQADTKVVLAPLIPKCYTPGIEAKKSVDDCIIKNGSLWVSGWVGDRVNMEVG